MVIAIQFGQSALDYKNLKAMWKKKKKRKMRRKERKKLAFDSG